MTQAVGFAEEHYIKAFEDFISWIEKVRATCLFVFWGETNRPVLNSRKEKPENYKNAHTKVYHIE